MKLNIGFIFTANKIAKAFKNMQERIRYYNKCIRVSKINCRIPYIMKKNTLTIISVIMSTNILLSFFKFTYYVIQHS